MATPIGTSADGRTPRGPSQRRGAERRFAPAPLRRLVAPRPGSVAACPPALLPGPVDVVASRPGGDAISFGTRFTE